MRKVLPPIQNNHQVLSSTSSSGSLADVKRKKGSTSSSSNCDEDSQQQSKMVMMIKPIVKYENFTAEHKFGKLRDAIRAIFEHRTKEYSFEELYRFTYDLVLDGMATRLLEGTIIPSIDNYLKEFIRGQLFCDDGVRGEEEFLRRLVGIWETHFEATRLFESVFMYLDKSFLRVQSANSMFTVDYDGDDDYHGKKGKKSIKGISMALFARQLNSFKGVSVIGSGVERPLSKDMTSSLLIMLQRERDGERIEHLLVEKTLSMLILLDKYGDNVSRSLEHHFTLPFLEASKEFFGRDRDLKLCLEDLSAYLKRVEQLRDLEMKRTYFYRLPTKEDGELNALFAREEQLLRDRILSCLKTVMLSGEGVGRSILLNLKGPLSFQGHLERILTISDEDFEVAIANSVLGKLFNWFEWAESPELIDQLGALGIHPFIMKRTLEAGEEEEEAKKKAIISSPSPSDRRKRSTTTQLHFVEWTRSMIRMRHRMLRINEVCFGTQFAALIDKAFREAIDSFGKSSKYLALYLHEILTVSSSDQEDESSKNVELDSVLALTRFISLDKDRFELAYQSLLSKRLLDFNHSANIERERRVLEFVKENWGSAFVRKMESMFNDVNVTSADLTREFNDDKVGKRKKSISSCCLFRPFVLAAGSWPIQMSSTKRSGGGGGGVYYTNNNLCIKKNLSEMTPIQDFINFYGEKFNGRRLDFQLHLGNAVVRYDFKAAAIDLMVNTVQMLILIECFQDDSNESSSLSLQEISEITGITSNIPLLEANLKVLCHTSNPIMRTCTKGTETLYQLNGDWKPSRRKIKFPNPIAKSSEEAESTASSDDNNNNYLDPESERKILMQRREAVEAAIVRILKTRKRIEHNQLVLEVINLLYNGGNSYSINSNSKNSNNTGVSLGLVNQQKQQQLIKQRIEHLIEKEYLRRDSQVKNIYEYIA